MGAVLSGELGCAAACCPRVGHHPARAVAAQASARGMATAEVAGTGVLAALVTTALPAADRRTPHVIVETEGSARALTDAIARVARLGTVVLAARPAMPDLMARTHGDLHVRGLTIVGVPWASADPASAHAPEDASEDEESVQWALGHLRLWGEQ